MKCIKEWEFSPITRNPRKLLTIATFRVMNEGVVGAFLKMVALVTLHKFNTQNNKFEK